MVVCGRRTGLSSPPRAERIGDMNEMRHQPWAKPVDGHAATVCSACGAPWPCDEAVEPELSYPPGWVVGGTIPSPFRQRHIQ